MNLSRPDMVFNVSMLSRAVKDVDLNRVKSTAGIIIFLKGPYGSAPILWRSRAIRRVCKSVKTAETLALEEAVDAAINLSRQIYQMITGKKEEKGITIRAYTDSKSLVDSVQSCKQVVEGSMRQVVEKLKEHVLDGHVAEITWVRGARNWADGLTKKTVDMVDLIRILETGRL